MKSKFVCFKLYFINPDRRIHMSGLNAFWKVRKKVVYHVTASFFALAISSSAYAAPSGGVVTAGQATINQSGNTTNINQSSQNAAINWQKFGIAPSETVNFVQPNVSSITLNRVVGNEQSVINGALNANGQVFILNSNGILFGNGAKINTAGLVATTMSLSDADFMAGNYNFSGASDASVINLGEITIKDAGYAALLAKNVENGGSITAVKGKIYMVGADSVSINLNGNSLVNLTVDKGVVDALVKNNGAVIANGGEIYLTANAADELLKSVVNNEGILEAQTLDDIQGKIIVFAHGGDAEISGTLSTGAGEGFIETSGKNFILDGATVVKTGKWLIDPDNVTIDSSNVGGYTTALAGGTDVAITTTSAGSDAGNITVSADVEWAGSGNLTLTADNDINVNSNIVATPTASADGGSITLDAGHDITLAELKNIKTNGYESNVSGNSHEGGNITITADNDINLLGKIESNNGYNYPDDIRINSGAIKVSAGRDLSVYAVYGNYRDDAYGMELSAGRNLTATSQISSLWSNAKLMAGNDMILKASVSQGTLDASAKNIDVVELYVEGDLNNTGVSLNAEEKLTVENMVSLRNIRHAEINYGSVDYTSSSAYFKVDDASRSYMSEMTINGDVYKIIWTADDFNNVVRNDLTGNYVLGDKIFSFNSSSAQVGGAFTGDNYDSAFSGKFNGLGNTIHFNVSSDANSVTGSGLFRAVTGDADISGLQIEGYYNGTGYGSTGALVGAVVRDDGDTGTVKIHDIWVNGLTIEGVNTVGSVVGSADGAEIYDIKANYATVTGHNTSNGGIVGAAENSTIHDISVANSQINGGAYNTGGIIGYAKNSVISDISVDTITVDGGSYFYGGIAGGIEKTTLSNSEVKNSNIENGSNYAGGIVGAASESVIDNVSVVNTAISANYAGAGGIVGVIGSSLIKDSLVEDTRVSAANNAGGVFGEMDLRGPAVTSNTYYDMSTTSINGNTDVLTYGGLTASNFSDVKFGDPIANTLTQDTDGYYLVGSAADFVLMSQLALQNINFRLSADIDLSGIPDLYIPALNGVLDGNGKTISNLNLTDQSNSNKGLVGMLMGGTIKSLTLSGANVTGLNNTGILTGWAFGEVDPLTYAVTGSSVISDVTVNGGSKYYFTSDSKSYEIHNIGAIAGAVTDGTVFSNVKYVSSGSVPAINVDIDNSSYANISMFNFGGLIGYLYGYGNGTAVFGENVSTDADISLNISGSGYMVANSIGGFIGYADNRNNDTTMDIKVNTTSDISIIGDGNSMMYVREVGGAIGGVEEGDISVVNSDTTIDINLSANTKSISWVGGLVGYSRYGTTYFNADSTSTITINNSSNGTIEQVGGYIGYATGSFFGETNTSVANMSITGSRLNGVGGFIGNSVANNYNDITFNENNLTQFSLNSANTSYGIGLFLGFSDGDNIVNTDISGSLDLTHLGGVSNAGLVAGSFSGHQDNDYKLSFDDSYEGDQTATYQPIVDGYAALYTDELRNQGYIFKTYCGYDDYDNMTYVEAYIYKPGVIRGVMKDVNVNGNISAVAGDKIGLASGFTSETEISNLNVTGNIQTTGAVSEVGGLFGYFVGSTDSVNGPDGYGDVYSEEGALAAIEAFKAANPYYGMNGFKLDVDYDESHWSAEYSKEVMFGTIKNSSYSGEISMSGNSSNVGGIVGYATNGEIKSVNSDADITVTGSTAASEKIGGLIGMAENGGLISDSVATGSLNIAGASAANIGGLFGYMSGKVDGVHTDSTVQVTAAAALNVGGLIGYLSDNTVSDSYFEGEVNVNSATSAENIGGFAGVNNSSKIEPGVYSSGSVTVNSASVSNVGGFLGTASYMEVSMPIASNIFMTEEAAAAYADNILTAFADQITALNGEGKYEITESGGAFMVVVSVFISSGALDGAYATGDVTVTGAGQNVGGLIGYSNTAPVKNSYSTGTVTAGDSSAVGGLVGYLSGGKIDSSYSTSNVTGGDSTGGLAGLAEQSEISDSYASGNVDGADMVGGLIGNATSSTVTHTLAMGEVTGTGVNVKGLVGAADESSEITSSFYNKTVNPDLEDAEGFGKTTEELQTLATYEGWDIEEVQGGSGYPSLSMNEVDAKWQIPAGFSLADLIQQALDNLQPDVSGMTTNINSLVTALGSYENLSESQISILVQAFNEALAALSEASDASGEVNGIYDSISDAADKDALEGYVAQANEALEAFNTSYAAAQALIEDLGSFVADVNSAVADVKASIDGASTANSAASASAAQAQTAAGTIPDSSVTSPLEEVTIYASQAQTASQAAALLEEAMANGTLDEIKALKATAEEYKTAAQAAAEAAAAALAQTTQAAGAYNTALASAQTTAQIAAAAAQTASTSAASSLEDAQTAAGTIPDSSVTSPLEEVTTYASQAQAAYQAAALLEAAMANGTLDEINALKVKAEEYKATAQAAAEAAASALALTTQAVGTYNTALASAQTTAQIAAAAAETALQSVASSHEDAQTAAGTIPDSSVTSPLGEFTTYASQAQAAYQAAALLEAAMENGTLDEINALKVKAEEYKATAQAAAEAAASALALTTQAVGTYNTALASAQTTAQIAAAGAQTALQSASQVLTQAQSLVGSINDAAVAAAMSNVAKYVADVQTAYQSASLAASGIDGTKVLADIEAGKVAAGTAYDAAETALASALAALAATQSAVTAYNAAHQPTTPTTPTTPTAPVVPETPAVAQQTAQAQSVISSIVNTTVTTMPPIVIPAFQPATLPAPVNPAIVPAAIVQSLGFGGAGGSSVTIMSEPVAGETLATVSMSELQGSTAGTSGSGLGSGTPGAETDGAVPSPSPDVRVRIGGDSIVELVNGGMSMPEGVDQQFYVVRRGGN